jgi:exopolyphosphatase/guanosine-5'-triphosphate,3'-diphosphate pyrophosphatase
MRVGVVRLTEEVLMGDPPEPEQIKQASELVRDNADSVKRELGELGGTTLVGTAGTITTLAAMAQQLRVYQPARIHNYPLSFSQVTHLEKELLPRPTVQRRGMAGLEAGREDVIAAGALMLRVIMETFGFTTCVVSDYGLREGIILDLARRLAAAGTGEGQGLSG